jgi:hypothetical protein
MKRVLVFGYLVSLCVIVLGTARPSFGQISLFKIAGAPLILMGGTRTPREYFWSYCDPAAAANGRIQKPV